MPKDGRSRGKRTYRCGDCKYRYNTDGNLHRYPEKTIRQALDCRREGMSVSAIARAMEINCAAVYGWVKKAQEAMTAMGMERERRNPSAADIPHSVKMIRGIDAERAEASVISFDEVWTYVGARTAAVEEADGSLRFDFEVGERNLPMFHRLLRRLPSAEKYRSDGCEALGYLPAGRRERGKGSEVNRNEGLRAKLRTRLNRLGRATSGCSKKLETLANSLALV